MSTDVRSQRFRGREFAAAEPVAGTAISAIVAIVAALAVGMVAGEHRFAGTVVVATAIAATWLAFVRSERRTLILIVLVVAIFTEGIDLAGISVDRLVSPIALVALVVGLVAGDRFPIGPPIHWVALYVLWSVASGIWTIDVSHTVTVLFSLGTALVFMAGFAIFVNSRAMLNRVLYATTATAFVVGILGSFSFFQGEVARSGGTVGDYNFFAAYELFALPLVLVLLGTVGSRLAQAGCVASVLAIIAGMLTTLSRGGALSLIVVMIVMLIWPAWKLFATRAHKTTFIVAAVLGTLALITIPQQQVLPRLTSVFSQKDKGSGRVNAWLAARTSIRERPVLGLGYGGFLPASNDLMRRTPGVDLVNFDLRKRGLEPHNAYIGTTAELGFPGLLFFVGILVSTALTFWRIARRAARVGAFFLMRVANALLVSLIGWCVASIFLSSETNKPLWVMVGLALTLPRLVDAEASGDRAWGTPPR